VFRSFTQRVASLLDPTQRSRKEARTLETVLARRDALSSQPAGELQRKAREAASIEDAIAVAALAVEHVLGMRPFDVQILGAIAMANRKIAEMQTGEGKTLTAVMTVFWLSRSGPVHVLTANDYLARRDCEWMGPVYRFLGLSCGFLAQSSTPAERRAAYACDVMYATPNEVGFDYLRDGLAATADDLVQSDLCHALIDEADSILIDEARIPLVIAGGEAAPADVVRRIDEVVRTLRPYIDFHRDEFARNVLLTDTGAAKVEAALFCHNLYDNVTLFTAVTDSLHAHVLLHRDVDYLVRDGRIQLVDEFKGRIADQRRWPAGLQLALEAKEGLALQPQGRILGTITLQSLVRLYETTCGMTGTAATQAAEFARIYNLEVEVIPSNKPVIRADDPDVMFADSEARDRAVIEEIVKAHAKGQPVLVGTASVADSERVSNRLKTRGVPHHVLNARNDAQEARIIAQAGSLGAVTISTNMAGRGTDIILGGNPPTDGGRVRELGGLYVIGTCRHEARRIDHQLRGRAGRQGDPGRSRFFLSFDDDLLVRFGLRHILRPEDFSVEGAVDHVQRIIEGQNLEIRRTLFKYDQVLEGHRNVTQSIRRSLLLGETECANRQAALLAIDEIWADYLADIAEWKSGIHWVSFGGRDPFHTFLQEAEAIFEEARARMQAAIEDPEAAGPSGDFQRGATWTYLTSDQPLGDLNQRFFRGIGEKVRLWLAGVR
jgi:preprotein translocase subunit SecA